MKFAITNHFFERWKERVGETSKAEVKRIVERAVQTGRLRFDDDAFYFDIDGYRAVVTFMPHGFVFLTVIKGERDGKETLASSG